MFILGAIPDCKCINLVIGALDDEFWPRAVAR